MTIPLFPAERAELERLRTEVIALREWKDAWAASDGGQRRAEAMATQVTRLRQVVPTEGIDHGRAGALRLILVMMERPGEVFSHERIISRVAVRDETDLALSRVLAGVARKALARAGWPDAIENVHGVGYRLRPDVAADLARRMGAMS